MCLGVMAACLDRVVILAEAVPPVWAVVAPRSAQEESQVYLARTESPEHRELMGPGISEPKQMLVFDQI